MGTVGIAVVSLVVSVLSLILSAMVALYTLVWRGQLKMSRPTHIAFLYDPSDEDVNAPKVVVRALLYATGKRGVLIENMFLKLSFEGGDQSFGVWGVSESKLDRGAGLFIPETGVVAYHHFVASDWDDFEFHPGEYEMCIYACVVGRKRPIRLFSALLKNDDIQAVVPSSIFNFSWVPDQQRYIGYRRI